MSDLPYLDVNRYGVLKVPALLWAILLLQTRHWWMLLFIGASLRHAPQTASLLGNLAWIDLALEAPTLLLLLALAHRVPEAGRLVRGLWQRGREILSVSALLHLGWTAFILTHSPIWSPWPERAMLAAALLDVLILMRLWRSDLIRQVFAEFPAPPDSNQAKTAS